MIEGSPDWEWVLYRPANDPARRVKALVDREGVETVPGVRTRGTFLALVTVANDEHDGVSTRDVKTGGAAGADRLDIAMRVGAEETTCWVSAIPVHDSGQVVLEARGALA